MRTAIVSVVVMKVVVVVVVVEEVVELVVVVIKRCPLLREMSSATGVGTASLCCMRTTMVSVVG